MSIFYSIELTDEQRVLFSETVEANPVRLSFGVEAHLLRGAPIGWSWEKRERIVRQSYGIICMRDDRWRYRDKTGYRKRFKRYEYYVPRNNFEALTQALDTGEFSKQIEETDIGILKVLYERDRELRELYGYNWNPRFYAGEIVRRLDLRKKDKSFVIDSLNRLVGLLVRTDTQQISRKGVVERKDGTIFWVYVQVPAWFLPTSRVSDVERVLEQFPQ